MPIDRREALKRIAGAGLVLGGAGAIAKLAHDRGGAQKKHEGAPMTRDFAQSAASRAASIAVARAKPTAEGGLYSPADIDPAGLVRRAVDALGGMRRFVSNRDRVVVKPNCGWDRMPLHAANTNPLVVAEVVRLCYEAGAKDVVVTDASCNEAARCFTQSGIWDAAYHAGAEVQLPTSHHFRSMRLKGEVLSDWPVYKTLIDTDKLINVPVAKHHNLAKYTGAMKNWYGSLGGRRNRLHQNIDVSVADLATFLRPTLTVLDATRVLMRNGPQGGNISDAKDMHTIIASVDQVAADAMGCELIGLDASMVKYIGMGHERGLGTMDYASLQPVEA
ncbi:MAG: DUF362 domain-containing protein [Polyangiaceae bacterium]